MESAGHIGRTLEGNIQLIEELGQEGLGLLYLGVDSEGRRYRVKILRKEASVARKRFARELEAVRTLKHEGVLPAVGEGELDGQPYILFEHVEGTPLTDYLHQAAPLPPAQALSIARQILSVLQAAHAAHLVHRNLTPDSILVVREGESPEVRVRDFGLARIESASAEGDQPVTAANVRVGRLTYMAPEYVETGEASPAMDLYALGVLLFEMLTGVAPPVATYPLPPPTTEKPDLPKSLDTIVGRLTTPDPADRASLSEAASLLAPPRSKLPWIAAAAAGMGVGAMSLFGVGTLTALLILWWALS